MSATWRRVWRGLYEYRDGGTGAVLATVEADYPPNNSHIAIWSVQGETLGHPTLRDAKTRAERLVREGRLPKPSCRVMPSGIGLSRETAVGGDARAER